MAKNRVKAFKDVRNAPGGQDDRSQPTVLFLVVANERCCLEERTIPASSPPIHS